MSAARFADGYPALASVLAGSVLSLAVLAQETVPTQHGDADLANGRRLYAAHCQRCHGSNGDDITCSGDMTPLAGLGRRPRVDLVGQVTSPSYFLRGVSYEGANARDLTGFLLSLKGEKGFDDPGLLCMPRLLSKKYGLLDHYRVVDLRDGTAYAQGHIPNAARWPGLEEVGERRARAADVVAQKLGLLAVRPEMAVVIYDDTLTPASALLWWDLVRAGQNNVTILDGGFRRWVEDGDQVTTVVTPLVPGTYASAEAVEGAAVHEGLYLALHSLPWWWVTQPYIRAVASSFGLVLVAGGIPAGLAFLDAAKMAALHHAFSCSVPASAPIYTKPSS